jgi:hypothetical protein
MPRIRPHSKSVRALAPIQGCSMSVASATPHPRRSTTSMVYPPASTNCKNRHYRRKRSIENDLRILILWTFVIECATSSLPMRNEPAGIRLITLPLLSPDRLKATPCLRLLQPRVLFSYEELFNQQHRLLSVLRAERMWNAARSVMDTPW